MSELSVAALKPAAAPGTSASSTPRTAQADTQRAGEPASRATGERTARREPGDRRPAERAERPPQREKTHNGAAENGDKPRQADTTSTSPDTSTQAGEGRETEQEQHFAALLAAQMNPAVTAPQDAVRKELAAGVQAAMSGQPAATMLPAGNGLPPAALSDALQRHASSAAAPVQTLAGSASAEAEGVMALTRAGQGDAVEMPLEMTGEKIRSAVEMLRAVPAGHLAAQAGKEAERGAGESLLQTHGLAARGAAESLDGLPAARTLTTVEAPLGSARWSQAFGERVSWLVREGSQIASMRLDPPQLGPVDVRVSISNGEASLSFVAQHGTVRDAIQDALPRLREMLGEQGLTLGDVDVSGRDARGEDAGGRGAKGAAADNPHGLHTDNAEEGEALRPVPVRVQQGLLDHYV